VAIALPLTPMKAVLGLLPPEREDHSWAYEIKWDGYRTLAGVRVGPGPAGAARDLWLQSSNRLDVTVKYPELRDLPAAVEARSAILDGELVVFGPEGRPTFELMQRHERPVVFQAFDVLSIDGRDVVAEPYERRRELLAGLLATGSNWSVPGHRIGGGVELLEATRERDLEGVMAKRLGSPYQVGKRTPNWRKVKNRRRVQLVVGGYTDGTGNRSSTFGSLLVGQPTPDGALRFAGGIGTGFDQRTLESLLQQLRSLRRDTCPFTPTPPREYVRGARWVEPELVIDAEITEFTNEGLVRHGSFVGLAEDP